MTDQCGCGRSTRGAGTGPHHESYCDEYTREPGQKLPEWRDDTTYTYGKPKSEQPVRVVSVELDGVRLVLHRLIHLPGWYCSLSDSGRDLLRDRNLTEDDIDIEDAKVLALQMGVAELQERTARYEELLERFRRA